MRIKIWMWQKIFPEGREYLFNHIMLKTTLTENCVFVEIGSSDGLETSQAIRFTNGTADCYLIEPSVRNLEISRNNIRKKSGRFFNKVRFINRAVGAVHGSVDFFYSKERPNQSSTFCPSINAITIKVKAMTIDQVISVNKIDQSRHIVIKMDVEGAEVAILKSAINFLKDLKRVSLLLEVHPSLYINDSMKRVFEDLFRVGFKTKLIESAWVRRPVKFAERSMNPVFTFHNRALYADVDDQFVAEFASKEAINIGNITPFYTKKIIRSVLLEKL